MTKTSTCVPFKCENILWNFVVKKLKMLVAVVANLKLLNRSSRSLFVEFVEFIHSQSFRGNINFSGKKLAKYRQN